MKYNIREQKLQENYITCVILFIWYIRLYSYTCKILFFAFFHFANFHKTEQLTAHSFPINKLNNVWFFCSFFSPFLAIRFSLQLCEKRDERSAYLEGCEISDSRREQMNASEDTISTDIFVLRHSWWQLLRNVNCSQQASRSDRALHCCFCCPTAFVPIICLCGRVCEYV